MLCAIYTRYSSDLQRESSIEDQERRCRQFAEQQGWAVVEEFVLADKALSGASLAGRGRLEALIQAAKRKPRPFDRLLVDDTSRLARDYADSSKLVKTLQFYGVEVSVVANGIDTSQKSSKMTMAVMGIIDEQYLDGLAEKVHRGQEGRVLKGFNPGGRIYGYRNVPIEDPTRTAKYGRPAVLGVRLEIIEEQAAVIRRMFDLYAAGMGFGAIAKLLNAEGTRSPQPPRNRPDKGWCPTAVRAMLNNERYRGVFQWNRTKKVRNPETGKKTSRERTATDHVSQEVPEWRIVTEDQWEAVRRQNARVNASGIHRLGGQCRTEKSRSYVFSGLLVCATCGSKMVIVSGGGKRGYVKYGCPCHRYRGTCENKLYIRQDRLEAQLLAALEQRLFQPGLLDSITSLVREGVAQRIAEMERQGEFTTVDSLKLRRDDLQAQVDRLTDAIATTDGMAVLVAKLKAVDTERQTVESQIAAYHPMDLKVTDQQVRQHVNKTLLTLRTLLDGDNVLAARAALQKHIPQLVLTPVEREGEPIYKVSGGVNLDGESKCVMQMVARDGLEPPTPAFSGPRSTN